MKDPTVPGGGRNEIAAVLAMQAAMMTLDSYSTFQSSPWTVENFGGDEEKMGACREYLMHAVAVSTFYTLAASMLARSWWPALGGVSANAYLIWLYTRAMRRGSDSGSAGWHKGITPKMWPGSGQTL